MGSDDESVIAGREDVGWDGALESADLVRGAAQQVPHVEAPDEGLGFSQQLPANLGRAGVVNEDAVRARRGVSIDNPAADRDAGVWVVAPTGRGLFNRANDVGFATGGRVYAWQPAYDLRWSGRSRNRRRHDGLGERLRGWKES